MNIVQPFPKERINDIAIWLKNYNEKYYVIFLIGISVGIRISDILNLKISDMDNTDRIVIKEKKTGKTKIFPLKPVIANIIKDYIRDFCNEYQEYIFIGKKGAKLDRSAVYRVLNRCIKELNINYKTGCHSLRKYCGRAIYDQTKDLAIVMNIFNHSSQRISARYIGLTEDRIKDTYLNLDLGIKL